MCVCVCVCVCVQDAIVQCVHMPRVNLEGASLKGCSMDARLGRNTNLEGEYIRI